MQERPPGFSGGRPRANLAAFVSDRVTVLEAAQADEQAAAVSATRAGRRIVESGVDWSRKKKSCPEVGL